MTWIEGLAYSWEFWLIAGLLLVVLDLLIGASGNVIALGCSCFVMSVLAAVSQVTDLSLIPNWKIAAIEFAVFSAAAMFVARLVRPHPSDEDINKY